MEVKSCVNTLKPVSLSLTLCSFHINYCRRTVKSTQKRLHFKWNSFHFIVILIKNSYFTGLLLYALHHAEQWKKFEIWEREKSRLKEPSLRSFIISCISSQQQQRRQLSSSSLSTLVCLIITLNAVVITFASSEYDSIECDPHSNRARGGRARLIQSIPCDLTKQNFCNLPGDSYPW